MLDKLLDLPGVAEESPKPVRLDCRKSCENSGGKAFGLSIVFLQKVSTPISDIPRPNPVLIIDCKCEKRGSSLPVPDGALGELVTTRDTSGSNSSSGRHLGPLPSSVSEEFAATAAAVASERMSDTLPGTLLSLVLTFPRSPVRAIPRGGYVMSQSLPLDGDRLVTHS